MVFAVIPLLCIRLQLLGLAVECVLSAHFAELTQLDPVGVATFILCSCVVSGLTLSAGQCDYYSGISSHTIPQTFLRTTWGLLRTGGYPVFMFYQVVRK